ncbi:MAG: hypothetical protein ACOC9Y_01295 [Chloroflexota bacterium]
MRQFCVSKPAIAVFLAAFAFFTAMLPHWTARLDPLTGDEPFYVMTALSIVRDLDLDESNNYEIVEMETEGGTTTLYRFDPELYPPDPLPPDWQGWESPPDLVGPHAATTEREGYYTKHGLGLSFLIALPFEAFGRLGANLVVIIFGSALASQMYFLARESGAGIHSAVTGALLLTVAMPIGPYSLLLFPEVPAALLLVYAVRRLAAQENRYWQWLLSGTAIGFLPWLHQRFAVSATILAVIGIAMLLRSGRGRQIPWFAVPIGTAGLLLLGYNQWLYGVPFQRVEDHAGFNDLSGTINGAFGLLLDAQWGLLIAAPLMVLAISYYPVLAVQTPALLRISLAACAPYLLVVAAYSVWWGEWGPPSRYLVPVVPFAAATLGAFLQQGYLIRWAIVVVMAVPGLILTLLGYVAPQRFYHHPDGRNKLVAALDSHLGTDIIGVLVAFQPYAVAPLHERIWISILLVAATCLLTAVSLLIVVRKRPQSGDDRVKRTYVR